MKLKPKSTVKNPKALVYKRFTNTEISLNKNSVYKTFDDKYWVFDVNGVFIELAEPVQTYTIVTETSWLKYQETYYEYKFENNQYMWVKLTQEQIDIGPTISVNNNVPAITSFHSTTITIPVTRQFANYTITLDGSNKLFGITVEIYDNNKLYRFRDTSVSLVNIEVTPTYIEDVEPTSNKIVIKLSTFTDKDPFVLTTKYNVVQTTILSAKFSNIGKYQTNKYYYAGSFDYIIKGSIEGTTAQYIKGNIIPLTSFNIKHFNDSINLSPDDLVVIENKLFSVENPETVLKQQPKPYKVYSATLNNIL